MRIKIDKGGGKEGGGKDKGVFGNINWVDGAATYGAGAAGKLTPPPGMFPWRKPDLFMESPNSGIASLPGRQIECAFCKKQGHQFSECPAQEWQAGGKSYVNFRWLYKKGLCDGKGQNSDWARLQRSCCATRTRLAKYWKRRKDI